MTRLPGRRGQAGFTLLEAIVALVLVSTLAGALYSWVNTELSSLTTIQRSVLRANLGRNALAYLEGVNPAAEPSGRFTMGDYQASWESTLLSEMRPGSNYPRGTGLFDIGYYHTRVEITQQDRLVVGYDFTQVGYVQARKPQYE